MIIEALVGLTIGAHLGTWHEQPGYNDFNPGVYVKHESGFTAGVYYNSQRHTSAYVGYSLDWKMFSLTLGAVTGYESRNVLPLAVPSMRLGSDDFAVRVSFLPRAEKEGTNAFHFSIERKF